MGPAKFLGVDCVEQRSSRCIALQSGCWKSGSTPAVRLDAALNTWRFAQACAIGTSHIERNVPCEDSCFSDVIVSPGDGEIFVAFVADGAGSSPRGGDAAELACVKAFELVSNWLKQQQDAIPPSLEDMRGWLESVRAAITAAADAEGCPVKDWASTLLGAICSPKFSAFLQIGDGVIVARHGETLSPVFWPQSGEYVNETAFLVSPGSIENSGLSVGGPVDAVALMSDGLQALALNYQARTAFQPFFQPLLENLSSETDIQVFESKLQTFLTSKVVNQRTNDDKTLVLAVRAHASVR